MSFSTPLYGLAVQDEGGYGCAQKFMDYLESWIKHFEKMPEGTADCPTWEICIWKKSAHDSIFKANAIDLSNTNQRDKIIDFARLCNRIYKLEATGRVSCKLYLSDESHTRWFFLTEENNYAGLIVIFSPLSQTAISTKKWKLVGFSFWDKESFDNLSPFNKILQHHDCEQHRINEIGVWKESEQWLLEYYS